VRLATTLLKDEESARDNRDLVCNVAKIIFTDDRLSNKSFLNFLNNISTTPEVCSYFGINVSQGSVATYARYGGIHYNYLAANLLENLPVKRFRNRLQFERIVAVSLLCSFWPTLYS